MKQKHITPLIDFRSQISDITNKFTLHDGITVDPETGVMHMPEGFARLIHHKPTNTVGLVFSDRVDHLTTTTLSQEALSKVKHIAAYRCKGDINAPLATHSNHQNMINRLTKDLRQFRDKALDRCQKHYTGYGVRLDEQDKFWRKSGINPETSTHIYTNGQIVYLIDQQKDDYKIKRYKPTIRKEGSFAPFSLVNRHLKDRFNRIASVIGSTKTLEDALSLIENDWAIMTDILKNEEDIFKNDTRSTRLKAKFHAAIDTLQHDIPRRLVTIGAVGSILGAVNPKYTLPAALLGAAVHTGLDMLIEGAYDASYEGRMRAKKSKRKPTADHYDFGENATYLFRKQDYKEIGKHESSIDATRYNADDFSFLSYDDMTLDNNTMRTGAYPYASSIEEQILYMHQRGVTSQCHLYDDNTVINYFENGVVRVMQYDQTTKRYSVYAQHHPDLVTDPSKDLSQNYKDQIGDNIIAYEYDRNNTDFSDALYCPADVITQSELIQRVTNAMVFKQTIHQAEKIMHTQDRLRQSFGKTASNDNQQRRLILPPPGNRNLNASAEELHAPHVINFD